MKAKPGELKAGWSKKENDIQYHWGEGVPRCDGHLLHNILCSKRMTLNFPPQEEEYCPKDYRWIQSFVDELKERGYDITTLKFSIRMKT